MSENSKIEQMNVQDRAYAKELLAASLLKEFRDLLNPELANAIADKAIVRIAMIQQYSQKVV